MMMMMGGLSGDQQHTYKQTNTPVLTVMTECVCVCGNFLVAPGNRICAANLRSRRRSQKKERGVFRVSGISETDDPFCVE